MPPMRGRTPVIDPRIKKKQKLHMVDQCSKLHFWLNWDFYIPILDGLTFIVPTTFLLMQWA